MAKFIEARVIQKVDTEANWMANPLKLYQGEVAFVSDKYNFKLNTTATPKTFAQLEYYYKGDILGGILPTDDLASKPDGVYRATISGTYGSVVVKEGYYTLLRKDNGVWKLESEVKMPEVSIEGKVEEGDTNAVSGGEVFTSINNFIGKKISTLDWKPRSNLNVFFKIGELFDYFNLNITTDIKKPDGNLRKIYIHSVQNISNQYFIRVRVENIDGTFKSYFKTGSQVDSLDIGIGSVVYKFVDISKLPVNNNTDATYEQGALLNEYVNILYNDFVSKLVSKTVDDLQYLNVKAVKIGYKQFLMFKTKFESNSTVKKITINGLNKGTKFLLAEVQKSGTLYNFVNKTSIITAVGNSDTVDVNFSISQNNYIGFQLIEGSINTASPIPSGVVRWEVYTGDISEKSSLDSSIDNINVNGDYPLIGFSTENSERTVTDIVNSIKNIVPNAEKYNSNLIKKAEVRSFIENPIYLKSPDGYNQFLHPHVLYFENKLFGYKYWLAVTPFPTTAPLYPDYYENPCVYASNNGLDWVEPSINPIDKIEDSQITSTGYMSDPCLCFKDGVLELWYRRHPATPSGNPSYICELLRKTTTDGINWSQREVMVPDMNKDNTFEFIAPKIYWDGFKYICYYTDLKVSNLARAYSVNGTTWTDFTPCTGLNTNIHADVMLHNGLYYAILHNTTAGKHKLLIYTSADGLSFSDRKEILTTDDFSFYSDVFYKSTLLHNGRDFLVYFTGGYIDNNGKYIRKIGLMKGKDIDSLKVLSANSVNNINIDGAINMINTDVKSSSINLNENSALLFDYSRNLLNIVKDSELNPFISFAK